MSASNNKEESTIEAQVQLLQNTISQWWNRIQTPDDDLAEDSEVMILGKLYQPSDVSFAINSRLWFTYRTGFEAIERAEDGPTPLSFLRYMIFNGKPNVALGGLFNSQYFITDMGWGCMIRTSQSLLANAFQQLVVGRQNSHADGEKAKGDIQEIVDLFGDDYEHPFSLHNFIKAASELPLEVKPGQWFGPSAASLSIKRLCAKFEGEGAPKLRVFISENCNLYDDEIEATFNSNKCPLFILFPIRLGIDKINSIYYPSLLQLLSLDNSVGIAGGKPSSSYYFFGYQGSNLLYLDPHNLQDKSSNPETYHTSRFQTLEISNLDPSMLAGILVSDYDDYITFKRKVIKENKIINFLERLLAREQTRSDSTDEYVQVSSNPVDSGTDDLVDVGESYILDDGSPNSTTPQDEEYEFV